MNYIKTLEKRLKKTKRIKNKLRLRELRDKFTLKAINFYLEHLEISEEERKNLTPEKLNQYLSQAKDIDSSKLPQYVKYLKQHNPELTFNQKPKKNYETLQEFQFLQYVQKFLENDWSPEGINKQERLDEIIGEFEISPIIVKEASDTSLTKERFKILSKYSRIPNKKNKAIRKFVDMELPNCYIGDCQW